MLVQLSLDTTCHRTPFFGRNRLDSIHYKAPITCPRHRLRAADTTRFPRVVRMSGSSGGDLRKRKLEEMVGNISKVFPEVENVSAAGLHAMLADPVQRVVCVDVRTPAEVAVSVIPGNTLTAAEFESQKEQLRGHTVVAYCTVGYRSSQFARRLAGEGYLAKNLAGSILAWTHEGYPLAVPPAASTAGAHPDQQQQPQPTTNKVHVFGKQWALQGEGFEPVMFGTPLVEMARSAARSMLPGWLGGRR